MENKLKKEHKGLLLIPTIFRDRQTELIASEPEKILTDYVSYLKEQEAFWKARYEICNACLKDIEEEKEVKRANVNALGYEI